MAYGVLIVTGGMTHQEQYARGFQADSRCRVIAVTDERDVDERRAALNRKLATELKVPYIDDLDTALRRDDIHVASICTEHHRQGRVGIRCAQAGKHIYMDKPVAGDLGEARQLERVIGEKKLKSQMFTQVLLPWSQRVRRAIRSGRIGDLRAIHSDLHFAKGYARDLPAAKRKEDPAPSRFLVTDAKREMFNIAVYSLALMRWVTGRKPFRTVMASTANYFFEQNLQRNFEDFAVMSVAMDGNIQGTISAGRTGWRSHPGGGTNRTTLIGTAGTMFLDGWTTHAEISGDRQEWMKTPPENPADPMAFWSSSDQRKTGGVEWFSWPPADLASDQSAFIECLASDREAEVTVADGVRILEVLLAAYRSAATGTVISLQPAR